MAFATHCQSFHLHFVIGGSSASRTFSSPNFASSQPLRYSVAFSGINFLAEHESIRYNAVHYGYSFDYSCRSCRWRNREAIDAGEDPGGFIVTILLGIAGAFIASYLGQALGWYKAGQPAGWIMSIVGAMILLLLYRFLFKRKQ